MTVTQFTDAVEIEGSQEIAQLKVQGNATQTTALQQWEDETATSLAQITGDGRLHVGDTPGMGASQALLQTHRDGASTNSPKRGLHISGEVEDASDATLIWSNYDLTLSGALTTTQQATGLSAQVLTDEADVETATALEVVIDKTDSSDVNQMIGVDIHDVENGIDNYAILTGNGIVHLGGPLELIEHAMSPSGITDLFRLVPKEGRLYGINAASEEVDLSQFAFTQTFANRPSLSIGEGDLFFPTDAPGIQRYDGSDWSTWNVSHKLTPPDLTGFSWVNQGSASASQVGESIYLLDPLHSGTSIRMMVMSVPSPPFTVTAYLIPALWHMSYNAAGLVWRESSSGKVVTAGFRAAQYGPSYSAYAMRYNSPTSYNSTQFFADMPDIPRWIRLEDDGTNRKTYLSVDGDHWILIDSISRTNFMTPNQVGFFLNADGSATFGDDCGLHLLSWEVTS